MGITPVLHHIEKNQGSIATFVAGVTEKQITGSLDCSWIWVTISSPRARSASLCAFLSLWRWPGEISKELYTSSDQGKKSPVRAPFFNILNLDLFCQTDDFIVPPKLDEISFYGKN